MFFASRILHKLGAKLVRIPEGAKDPESEEEFLQIDYESDTRYTWEQYLEIKDSVIQTYGIRLLRSHRNKLLTESDWILTVDNVERIANIEEWKQYRQALRDLPEQSIQFVWKNGMLDFEQMNLPQKPSIQTK